MRRGCADVADGDVGGPFRIPATRLRQLARVIEVHLNAWLPGLKIHLGRSSSEAMSTGFDWST